MSKTYSSRPLASILVLSLPMSALAPISALANEPEDEIIVTGSPLVRSVDEAITGVSVLSGDELSDRLAATIGETLKSEPGVSSTFFGAGASRPIIRGQGGDRVRVLTNGIGSIDASSASPDHAVAAEPAQAERIEVLRGASLLRYGSSGSGGIVNVIDGRIPDTVPDGIEGALRIGAESVNARRETAGSLDIGLGDNWVFHIDGTWQESDDYKIPVNGESELFHELEHEEGHDDDHDDDDHDDDHGDEDHEDEEYDPGNGGPLANSFSNSKSISAGLSRIGDRGYFGVAVHHFNSDYGVPGGHAHGEEGHDDDHDEDHDEDEDHDDDHDDEHDEDEHGHEEGEEESVTIGLEQTRIDLNGAVEFSGVIDRVQFFAGLADYEHKEFEAPGEVGTVFKNKGYEARIEAIQAETNGWSAAYGVQLRDREFSAIGDEAFVPPTDTQQLGAYMFHEKPFGDLHLEGAVRYESTKHENRADNISKTFNLLSLSAGGDVHLSESVRIGGTVFRTERAPTTEELFSNGPHLATQQFERGNINLGKESAKGIELALRHREDGHFLTANLFYTDYTDFIFETFSGEEEDGLPAYDFVSEDASFQGFEIQGGADITTWGAYEISADTLFEYVRAKTDLGNLPRIPPLSILSGIEVESERFKIRLELDYAARQDTLAADEIPTEDYALLNAFTTWKSPRGAQNVRLKLSVMNILNAEARQHTSFLKDNVPLPGRNVRISISTRF